MTETIAQRLRRLMGEARADGRKVTAKSLSLSIGGGETYVGDILRGRVRNPSMAKLARIARQLEIPIGRLIPAEDEPAPTAGYLELRDTAESFLRAEEAGRRPLLEPDILTMILAALPHAIRRIGRQPAAAQASEAIYRAHGWLLDEVAAGRQPSPDAVVNFLSHNL